MRKIFIYCFIAALLYCCFPSATWAAKKRPARGGGGSASWRTVRQTNSSTRGIKTSVKFRGDRRALLVSFSGFNSQMTSVSYLLTYDSSQGTQAGGGTITAATAGGERELLFGTSSAGVATYHANISSARLVIDTKLKSGLTIRKPYRIKV